MITERRASELALLCCEAALRHRAPNGGSPPADLAEWIAGHAQVAPELAALPEVARLLRSWPGRYAEAHVAAAAAAGPGSDRVDTGALPVVLTTREAAGCGSRTVESAGCAVVAASLAPITTGSPAPG